jgi:hypothetical protein
MSPLRPLGDALDIVKKDWRLLAALNALFFCVLIIGATIAVISPELHVSMINLIGADSISGSAGISDSSNQIQVAGLSFYSSFTYLLVIALPSVVLPIWGPIMGAARFFIWGVTYVTPLQGGMSMGDLLPQYMLMLIQGEAYIIAIFACIRQFSVAISALGLGFRQGVTLYLRSVADNLKLLLIVIILLAMAALYQALVLPALTSIL